MSIESRLVASPDHISETFPFVIHGPTENIDGLANRLSGTRVRRHQHTVDCRQQRLQHHQLAARRSNLTGLVTAKELRSRYHDGALPSLNDAKGGLIFLVGILDGMRLVAEIRSFTKAQPM